MSDFRLSQLSSYQGSGRLDSHLSQQPSLKPSSNFDGDLIANVVSMNFSGRFSGQEVKEVGYSVILHIVNSKAVSIFFGQQSTFRLTTLPDNLELVGSQRTFILYNKTLFQANDENQYKHFLRDLEMRGRLPKYYLPEANYSMCKMKCKV